jgi:hypothetical protein
VGVYGVASALFFNSQYGESGLVRFLKVILVLGTGAVTFLALLLVDGMMECLFSMCYLGAAIGCWTLLVFGANSRLVQTIYYIHDALLGAVYLSVILLLSALYVPGKIQTWLLYNNALSRGVVIEDILRANSRNDDREDDLSLQQMRSIIIEQQRVIAVLTSTGSESDLGSRGSTRNGKDEIAHTLSDNALRNNVSETDFAALQDASAKLQHIAQHEAPVNVNVVEKPGLSRIRRAVSSQNFQNNGLPPFSTNGHASNLKSE